MKTKIERAAQTGLSYKTLRNLERCGCDIWSDEDLRKHISRMRVLPKNIKPEFAPQSPRLDIDGELPTLDDLMKRLAACTDKHQAQTIRCQIDGLKAAHQLQVQQGEYIRADDAYRHGQQLGMALKQFMYYQMPAQLPPLLAGRTAAEMGKVLEDHAREWLTLAHEKGYLGDLVKEGH